MIIEPPSEQFKNDPRLGSLDSCARTLGRLLAEIYGNIENRRAYSEFETDVTEATEISDDWHIKSCFKRYQCEIKKLDNDSARYNKIIEYIIEVREYCKGEKFYPGDRTAAVNMVVYGAWRLEDSGIYICDVLLTNLSAHFVRILTRLIKNPQHTITVSEIVACSEKEMEVFRAPHQISKLRGCLRKHFTFVGEVIPQKNGEPETTYWLPEQTIMPKE